VLQDEVNAGLNTDMPRPVVFLLGGELPCEWCIEIESA
jgi:hypothetical protein